MIITGRDYEHTLAIPTAMDAPIRYQSVELGPVIQTILKGEPFDAAEFTLAGYIILHSRGVLDFTALPIFPARSFFHSCLWVRHDSPLCSLDDLSGRRIGLRDYSSTTSVWFRGHLKAHHGIDWRANTWVVGPGRRFPPPPEADVVAADGDLEDLLVSGDIDLFFSVRVRDQKKPLPERSLRPLLPDPQGAEADYYRQTGRFPLLHVVILSRAAASKDPQAADAIVGLFEQAKLSALRRKLGSTFLPWGEARWDSTMALFGGDPMPYGLTLANRAAIETLIDYLHDQRLISQRPDVDDLFQPARVTAR